MFSPKKLETSKFIRKGSILRRNSSHKKVPIYLMNEMERTVIINLLKN